MLERGALLGLFFKAKFFGSRDLTATFIVFCLTDHWSSKKRRERGTSQKNNSEQLNGPMPLLGRQVEML